MSIDTILTIMGVIAIVVNLTAMLSAFSCRYSLPFTIGAFVLWGALFYAGLHFFGLLVPDNGALPALAFLPAVLLLLNGPCFQKVFFFFQQLVLTAFQFVLAETLSGLFIGYGGTVSFAVMIGCLCILFVSYVLCLYWFQNQFFAKLFAYGNSATWLFYSLGAIFSYVMLTVSQMSPGSTSHVVLLLIFILWSLGVLCFTIINTNEKNRHKYEVDFARDMIASGSAHHQKMSDMHDRLRILRHDYKYHLDTLQELLSTDNRSEATQYLADVQKQLSDKELTSFCANSVINALLSGYYERCTALSIRLDVQISMPKDICVPNYEMCIVLGNLIENAIEASVQATGNRKIELVINTQGAHLAVMVKNSYSGTLVHEGGRPISTKKNGGLGLRSVRAVTALYGGELMTEWDDESFTAYVLLRI